MDRDDGGRPEAINRGGPHRGLENRSSSHAPARPSGSVCCACHRVNASRWSREAASRRWPFMNPPPQRRQAGQRRRVRLKQSSTNLANSVTCQLQRTSSMARLFTLRLAGRTDAPRHIPISSSLACLVVRCPEGCAREVLAKRFHDRPYGGVRARGATHVRERVARSLHDLEVDLVADLPSRLGLACVPDLFETGGLELEVLLRI